MRTKPETLYLDLMKKTLMFLLWPQPPIPVTLFNFHRPPVKRFLFSTVSKLFERTNYSVMQKWELTEDQRINGIGWIPYSHTHIGLKRLNNLQECIETVLRDGIEGDLIETGVWRGGATIFMKAVLTVYGDETRRVFVADSFEGLPKPDAERYPADEGDNFYEHPYTVSQEDVAENFRSFGLLDERVVFIKGWFEDTLPTAPVEKLSVLRLDGDMYGSTITALENLYPKLSTAGFCIIDDYILGPCRQAVHDYISKNNIDADIKDIDGSGAYWRKID